MSASPIFSSAATGRPFIFSPPASPRLIGNKAAEETTAKILAAVGANPRLATVVPASRLDVRSAPEMVSSGIPQLNLLTGGLGCLEFHWNSSLKLHWHAAAADAHAGRKSVS
jgi:hypothetical protein